VRAYISCRDLFLENRFIKRNAFNSTFFLDPSKNDSRASDSWQTLLHRLRLLTLQAYNRTLGRFEENMRAQRERRNSPNWNFCDYFLLQEELAFTYEMLGVYDEALVQYDELDALFTQFVLNSNVAGKKSGKIPLRVGDIFVTFSSG